MKVYKVKVTAPPVLNRNEGICRGHPSRSEVADLRVELLKAVLRKGAHRSRIRQKKKTGEWGRLKSD